MFDQSLDVPAASAAAAREHANELARERALAERSGAAPNADSGDRGLDEWRWLYFVAVVSEVESLRAELDAALNGD